MKETLDMRPLKYLHAKLIAAIVGVRCECGNRIRTTRNVVACNSCERVYRLYYCEPKRRR